MFMMKRHIGLFLGIFMVTVFVADAEEEIRLAEWKQTVSTINIFLRDSTLEPQVVLYALFEKDPVPEFIERLEKRKERHLKMLATTKPIERQELIRNAFIKAVWDRGFREIAGDKIDILMGDVFPVEEVTTPEGKKGLRCITSAVSVCSDTTIKGWIVTKIRSSSEKPTCWCIPVEVKIGKEVNVTLTQKNVFDVLKKYKEIIDQQQEDGRD